MLLVKHYDSCSSSQIKSFSACETIKTFGGCGSVETKPLGFFLKTRGNYLGAMALTKQNN